MVMSNIVITHMSSKGQVVIPQDIRKEIHAEEGTAFAVFGSKDTILLKKIHKPNKEELKKDWERLVEEGNKRVKELGIKETDVAKIIHRGRGIKYD